MGEARNRGTFEERKQQAVDRDIKLEQERSKEKPYRPSKRTMTILGMTSALGLGHRGLIR